MTTNVLVIGTGISGLTFAIKLASISPKTNIVLICKKDLMEGNTKYAQGGIAVVSNFKNDSFENHMRDTMVAGDFKCKKSVVEFVIKEGVERLEELINWGAEFDKNLNNQLDLMKEGGHSTQRIVHHKDNSGFEIQRALIKKIKKFKNIKYLENHLLVDLITDHHIGKLPKTCYGAYVMSIKDKEIIKINSEITVLSTGGAGEVFEFTTNPKGATGDGLGAAYRAKINIKNLPYVQFHPTALQKKVNGETFLITEAIRGKGAKLVNKKGERFMLNYDKRGELASRDIVARAIANEMLKENFEYMYLDATEIDTHTLKKNFPTILKKCNEVGINPLTDKIPIVPAAHYFCGGIDVDEYSRTNFDRLYAIGECSHTGLHGSNRLASNSLLESIVFSHRAAVDCLKKLNKSKLNFDFFKLIPEWNGKNSISNHELEIINKLRLNLQKIMSSKVGIFKTVNSLVNAEIELRSLYFEMLELYNKKKLTPQLCELRNLVSISYLMIKQSIEIKHNSGVYYNHDYAK